MVAGFLSLVALVGYFGAVVLLLYAFFAFLDNSGHSRRRVSVRSPWLPRSGAA